MFYPIIRCPELVWVKTGEGIFPMSPCGEGRFAYRGLLVRCVLDKEGLDVLLEESSLPVEGVLLRWKEAVAGKNLLLNDHWERSYGDLQWSTMQPEKVYPWYFMMFDGSRTHGYGVRTEPNAMCFWQVDGSGLGLWLDVRNGGGGLALTGRTLRAATVVAREGKEGESAFAAAKAFCRQMCARPARPVPYIYGGNNWYYNYGNSSAGEILDQAQTIADLAGQNRNRPFMVIDDGWQICHSASCTGGPWSAGNYKFPHMEELPARMAEMGVRAGLWFRPLLTSEAAPEEAVLPNSRFLPGLQYQYLNGQFLDPSAPYTLEKLAGDMRRFAEWGFQLVKHDFSSCDLFGRWGFQMGCTLTESGWHLYNRGITNAEAVKGLYHALRDAAPDLLIMGCNTFGHLSAGVFDISRTGDDTSGLEWERTRKMGVNTLAFRLPQHGVFYAADPDCVGLTRAVPWELNKQWLELVAATGTPLFVSMQLDMMGGEPSKAVAAAFAKADGPAPDAEPLDWMETSCPARWRFGDEIREFDWYTGEGVRIFSQI